MTTPALDNTAAPENVVPVGRRRLAPVCLFVGLFMVFAATSTRGPGSIDVTAPAMEAWHLATSGSPWLEGVYHHLPGNAWLQVVPNGHVVADRMAGPVLAALPFYLLAGGSTAPSSFSMLPAGVAAAVLTALTATLLYLALERRAGRRVALGVTLAFALATPTWSVSADAVWTHTLTQLGIAGAAYALSRDRHWLAGAFLAAGMTGRPHLALVAAVLGLGLGWTGRSVRPVLALGLPTAATLGLLTVWGHWMFGTWTFSSPGYGAHGAAALGGQPVAPGLVGVQAHLVNYLGFLVSPARGLLVWSPVVVVLLPAVLRAARRQPSWSRWLAVAGLVYTVAQLQMEEFTGGTWFYGYRYGLELLTCCVPLLAFCWPAAGATARRAVPVLLAVQMVAIAVGATATQFVVGADPWRFNAFVRVLGGAPALVGPLLVAAVACVLLLPRVAAERAERVPRGPQG